MPQTNENVFSSVGIDEQLLARQWRQQKREIEEKNQAKKEEEKGIDLRQSKILAKQKKDVKSKIKNKTEQVVTAPVNQFTNWLMRISILDMLFTLGTASFGASILYVHFHLFARAIGFGSIFPKLGNEWVPKSVMATGSKEVTDQIGAKFFWGEVALIIIVDLIWLVIILLGITFLTIIADVYTHPIKNLWNFAWGWVGDTFDSFF